MSTRSFQYQQRQPDAWQSRAEQSGGGFIGLLKDTVQTYTIKKTENWIRPLPPSWPNAKHYGFDIWVHYGVGPQNATVLCNLKMYNQYCCVCEAYTQADAEGRDDAYDYKAVRRVLIWLIDRKDEKTPLAWAMPWTLDRDITKLCKDRQTGELYQIDHPDNGYDVSFDREGEIPNVKYVGIQIARRPSPVADAHLEFISANPLPSILIKRTPEEIRALFEGGSSTQAPSPAQTQAPSPAQPQQSAPPWEQSNQLPPQQPPDPVQPNVQVQPSFCSATISFQGNSVGCGFIAGHTGNCDFQRMLGQAPQTVSPSQVPAPVPVLVPPQQPVQQQPVQQQPTLGGRAAALRERFANK